MSYAERKQMSSNRTAALVVVALIHLALGYALVTGLAYNVMKQAAEDLKTFDVEEEPPPPEEIPPPPENQPETPPRQRSRAAAAGRTHVSSPVQTRQTPAVRSERRGPAPPARGPPPVRNRAAKRPVICRACSRERYRRPRTMKSRARWRPAIGPTGRVEMQPSRIQRLAILDRRPAGLD